MVIQVLPQFMCFASIQNSYPICLFAFYWFLSYLGIVSYCLKVIIPWLIIIEGRKISSDCVCMYFCVCLLLYPSVVGQNISSLILVLLVREDRIMAIYGILIFKPFSYSGHFPVPENRRKMSSVRMSI